ncbi:WDR24 [Acanthosepion pharaonis]|uniref:GATOR2 complex protein WDR24 n=1 Tax=Acanthosepion pharaonis TaxID=158019 RepID=A0A812D905_ACAPH|nr:WDR24 [Sepia pharaonis]
MEEKREESIKQFGRQSNNFYMDPSEKVKENLAVSIQHYAQEPINAIALNRDSSRVVIAGRQVFKIISIENDKFVESVNFRVGKNINLNFSAADVTWNHIEENKLASAATNSSVVIWDLNKPSRSKLCDVYTSHKRTVNRVTFHNKEPFLLLSGSQDGDMKIFDTRRKEVTTTFSGKESVRDVQFCPQTDGYFRFAAGLENGIVQEWDIRRPDRPEREITAHTGPVFTLDWNPIDKNWLATGGRDRAIKVWDLPSRKLVHIVHTMASVAKCKWRPEHKQLIASSSLLVDFAVNIWDIRRPYIPLAAFNKHKDVASVDELNTPTPTCPPSNILQSLEPSMWANSNLFLFTPDNSFDLSVDWFVNFAKLYWLSGKSFEEICDHNASIAQKLNRKQVSLTWLILKTLFTCTSPNNITPPYHAGPGYPILSKIVEAIADKNCEIEKEHPTGENTSGCSDEESEAENEALPEKNLANIATGLANQTGDFFFGDGETDFPYDLDDNDSVVPDKQDWSLPAEAFQLRHELQFGMAPPVPMTHDSPASANDSDVNSFNTMGQSFGWRLMERHSLSKISLPFTLPCFISNFLTLHFLQSSSFLSHHPSLALSLLSPFPCSFSLIALPLLFLSHRPSLALSLSSPFLALSLLSPFLALSLLSPSLALSLRRLPLHFLSTRPSLALPFHRSSLLFFSPIASSLALSLLSPFPCTFSLIAFLTFSLIALPLLFLSYRPSLALSLLSPFPCTFSLIALPLHFLSYHPSLALSLLSPFPCTFSLIALPLLFLSYRPSLLFSLLSPFPCSFFLSYRPSLALSLLSPFPCSFSLIALPSRSLSHLLSLPLALSSPFRFSHLSPHLFTSLLTFSPLYRSLLAIPLILLIFQLSSLPREKC